MGDEAPDVERAPLEMDIDTTAAVAAAAASVEEDPAAAMSLQIRDDTITCVCPLGTQRLVKDLIMNVTKEKGITWLHRPCKPYAIKSHLSHGIDGAATTQVADDSIMTGVAEEGAVVEHGNDGRIGALSAFLGPNPTAKMLKKVKNFTRKFLCDGPCEHASKTLADYFMCRKCLAWQHNDCKLYGEPGDHGGPVCNHCYVDFLVNYEEIDKWQRRRLMEAVQEAVKFLTNPDTSHEVWRREWCKKFVRRFFAANKGHFVKFVATQRRAQRTPRNHRYNLRNQLPYMEPENDDAEEEHDVISLASSDNIKVRRPGTKLATKSGRPKERVRNPSPLLLNGGKRSHKANGQEPKKRRVKAPKSRPRKKPRLAKSPTPSEEEELSEPPHSQDRTPSPSSPPARLRKNKVSQLIGAMPARKSVRMSQVMKRPRIVFESEDDDVEDARDTGGEDEDDSNDNELYAADPPQYDNASEDNEYEPNVVDQLQYDKTPEDDGVNALLEGMASSGSRRGRSEPRVAAANEVEQPLGADMLDEIHQLCSGILWREYASLPSPNDDDDDKNPAQSLRRPPPDWLDECELRFTNMLIAAGSEKTAAYLEPVLKTFPRQADPVVRSLTEMALWMIRKGPWRKERAALGLLGEILGLDEKGRHWQGAGF